MRRISPVFCRCRLIASRAIFALSAGIVLSFLVAGGGFLAHTAENGGLGPLSIRNQFPVTLGFLTYTPEPVLTLPLDTFQFRYQYSITNSYINTQSPRNQTGPFIDSTAVSRSGGLVASDFAATGYGVYLDVEARRHQFRFNYAFTESLEIGLELSWIALGGGSLDSRIVSVEEFFGGLNRDRAFSEQNRFDFYLIRDGAFLLQSSQAFSSEPMDPVFNLKWTLSEGGEVLPATAIKLSYKFPLESNPDGSRALISSGGRDYGYYFLFSKEIGDVIAHIQFGITRLEVEPNTFSDSLRHKMFGLEFRVDEKNSLIMQSISQTSIFSDANIQTNLDFALASQTDVGILGFKTSGDGFLFEIGMIEDYNQQRNEDSLRHKMFGLEFRVDEKNSLIMQSISQTSIFSDANIQTNLDFALASQTDVGILGFKTSGDGFLFEIGMIEDYNQQRNEADITLYFELGWEW